MLLHFHGISDFYVLRKSPKIPEWISECYYENYKGKIVKIYFWKWRRCKLLEQKVAQAVSLPVISKHILISAQDDRTFDHWRKQDGRHLYGCTVARFLNISVICLWGYVLDMFFNMLNYQLEPHSICFTLEKPIYF